MQVSFNLVTDIKMGFSFAQSQCDSNNYFLVYSSSFPYTCESL